jgi:hypothetical protein
VSGKPGAWSSDETSSGWGQPAAIVNVGCCYHLLTEAEEKGKVGSDGRSAPDLSDSRGSNADTPDEQDGFPMSKRVASLGLSFGIGARMLACQAVERWPTKGEVERSHLGRRAAATEVDRTEERDECKQQEAEGTHVFSQKLGEADMMFRKHFYRGLLQCILEERFVKRPTEGKSKRKRKIDETAFGGPPLETLQTRRETGWVVGSQKKVEAVAAAVCADDSKSAGCCGAEAGTGEHRVHGQGKSWDQVVNCKVRAGSFASYAAAALRQLGLDTSSASGSVTEAELEEYERQHSHRRQEIAVRARCT